MSNIKFNTHKEDKKLLNSFIQVIEKRKDLLTKCKLLETNKARNLTYMLELLMIISKRFDELENSQ